MPTSIAIPQIKWGKTKERSQMFELLTDDGRSIDVELPVLFSCAIWEEKRMAFLIDPENQFLDKDGNWYQLVSEKSQVPLCLIKKSIYQDGKNDEKELSDLSDELYGLTFEQKIAEAISKAKGSEAWDKFMKLACLIIGAFLIFAGMQHFWR